MGIQANLSLSSTVLAPCMYQPLTISLSLTATKASWALNGLSATAPILTKVGYGLRVLYPCLGVLFKVASLCEDPVDFFLSFLSSWSGPSGLPLGILGT